MSFFKKLFKTTKRRYADINRHFWIFTYCPNAHSVAVTGVYSTGSVDCSSDERSSPYLVLGTGKKRLLIEMPLLVKPYKEKISLKGVYSEEELKKRGQDFYYNEYPRQYGFTFSDEALHVYYGPETHDSLTTKSACFFLFWKQWRYIGTTYYDAHGKEQCKYIEDRKAKDRWKIQDEAKAKVEKVHFEVQDADGTIVQVETYMSQMEHRFGDKYFKWLSWFRKPMFTRQVDLWFKTEVGESKGEWKGGLIGTSCNVLPGELHESAFKRWIAEEDKKRGRRSVHLKFLRQITANETTGEKLC